MVTHALTLIVLAAEISAPVTGAVLYGGTARVTRSAEVTADGRTRVELPLLSPAVDPDSVRVEATGAEIVTVDIDRLADRHALPERAKELATSLQRLDDDLGLLGAERAAIESALASTDQSPLGPDEEEDAEVPFAELDPARWRQTLAFLRGFSEKLDERRAGLVTRIEALQARRQALAAEAQALVSGDRGKVRVIVNLLGQGKVALRASYLITGPGWVPRYDVRLDPTRDEVTVSLAALARQETGEDWVSAALSFSTAIPQACQALPELPRWVIGDAERFMPRTVARAELPTPAPIMTPVVAIDPVRAELVRLGVARVETPPANLQIDGFQIQNLPPSSPPPPATEFIAGGSGIVGYVYDQAGNPLRGVKLTVSSPVLTGGSKVTYSNEEGGYRVPGLPPGTYEVRASAPKLRTVVQRNVAVGRGAAAEISLVMEVEGQVEEVRVLERAPIVSTTSANVKESYDLDLVETTRGDSVRNQPAHAMRRRISLAPPTGHARARLAPGMPAALAGGHDLLFAAPAADYLFSGAMARPVALGTWRWPVTVVRRLVPAVRGEAFLVAAIRSPASTVLPAGEVFLSLEGKPVGRAQLALLRPNQTFTLPLGMDRGVRAVRRVQLDSSQSSFLGLIDKDDVNRYIVTIDVANPHPRPVAIEVVDQIPKARDDSVTVKLESSNPVPVLDDKEGTVTWKLTLPAGSTRQLQFVYSLKHPHGNRLHQ